MTIQALDREQSEDDRPKKNGRGKKNAESAEGSAAVKVETGTDVATDTTEAPAQAPAADSTDNGSVSASAAALPISTADSPASPPSDEPKTPSPVSAQKGEPKSSALAVAEPKMPSPISPDNSKSTAPQSPGGTAPLPSPIESQSPPVPGNRKCLISPYLDFWLIGGASLVMWVVLYFAQFTPLSQHPGIARHTANIGAIFTTLSVIVNYPHFMLSYKLGYSQNRKFLLRNYFQLLVVPLFLLCLFTTSYMYWTEPVTNPISMTINQAAVFLGHPWLVNQYTNVGTEVLGLLLVLQYSLVGWHYCKQTFGVMMTYAGYSNYSMTAGQRNLIKWNLFGIWYIFFLNANTGMRTDQFMGLNYYSVDMPGWIMPVAQAYLWITLAIVIKKVFLDVYDKQKKLPDARMMAAYAAMYVWFLPMFFTPDYFGYVVPFAHSVQYLCFVYRVEERSSVHANRNLALHATWLIACVLTVGFLVNEIVPGMADQALAIQRFTQLSFMAICINIFINIHHYFIDNAIWQSKNQEVKKYLWT